MLAFLACRMFLGVCGIAFLVYSAATDAPPPDPNNPDPTMFAAAWLAYWKFYTVRIGQISKYTMYCKQSVLTFQPKKHWTLALCTLFFVVASLYSYWLSRREKTPHIIQSDNELNLEIDSRTEPLDSIGDITTDDEGGVVELSNGVVDSPAPTEGEEATDRQRFEAAEMLNDRMAPGASYHDRFRRRRPLRVLVSFGELCLWLGYETVWAASIFLSITFWIFIGLGCLPHKGCQNVPSHYWIGQLLNILFIAVEITLNKLPFIPTHSVWTLCYCILWLIFSTLLYVVTGEWVYPTENPHRGQLRAAFTFWPGWIVLNVVAFFIGLMIEWAIARIFPSKHSVMKPVASS